MRHVFWCLLGLSLLASCKKETKDKSAEVIETYAKGSTEMYVETSVYPIVEDLNMVFKSQYTDADIQLKMLPQNEILSAINKDSNRLAVLPKTFTSKELDRFKGRVVPKITPIAKDAVLFITQKGSTDSLINYTDVLAIVNGTKKTDKVFVLHDANSAIVSSMMKDANVKEVSKNVYYVKTVDEIVSYLASNNNAVGIVGINWMLQPDEKIKTAVKGLRSMLVYNDSLKKYIAPSQSSIADNSYPLIRTINIFDVQGKTGLGTGFASFAASDRGQRIILKSGLMPITMPKREINIVE